MRCPSAKDWDLLAMEVLGDEEAERMLTHARACAVCRERFQIARREHTERVRMYEAFDREHDELREQLMAGLPDETPQSAREGWMARGGRRLGGFAMSLNKSAGRRAAALLVPAACIVIALTVFLAPKQSAFAAALEKMRSASTIVTRYQLFLNDADAPMMQGTLYLSEERGMRFDADMTSGSGPLPGGVTFDGGVVSGRAAGMTIYREPNGPVVVVQAPLNLVVRMHGHDRMEGDPRRTSPDAFIQKFVEMAEEADHELGLAEVDGHEVEGFEISGKKLGLGFVGSGFSNAGDDDISRSAAVRLWVDVHANLPVRMEVEMDLHQLIGGHMLVVYDQFEWDVALEDDLFELEIPEGMHEVELTLPPVNEETLLEALQLFSDVTGYYPASLDPSSMSMEFAVAAVASGRIVTDDSDPASAVIGALAGDTLKLSMACGFVQKLAADGREPEYFGESVTADDSDKVLLRWELDDGEVRVIYGDLRVETRSASD